MPTPGDNTQLNPAAGGDIIAADEINGVKVQRVKIQVGADGVAQDVSDLNPIPTALVAGLKQDEFERTIVANSEIYAFDKTNTPAYQPFLWLLDTTGGGQAVYMTDARLMALTVGLANGDTVVRQTSQYMTWLVGRTLQISIGVRLDEAVAGVRQRVGYFDVRNGFFFEMLETGFGVVSRTDVSGSPIDTRINQSSWNLDRLDGTGPSGLTLIPDATQNFVIEVANRSRARFGFLLEGKIVFCHVLEGFNTLTGVADVGSVNLPIRMEVQNIAIPAQSTTMMYGGYDVSIIGGSERLIPGVPRHDSSGDVGVGGKIIGTDLEPIISFRFDPAAFRMGIGLADTIIRILNATGGNFEWRIYLNPVITGQTTPPSWHGGLAEARHLQTDHVRNGIIDLPASEILLIGGGYGSNNQDIVSEEAYSRELQSGLGFDFAGNPSEVVVAVRSLAGSDTYYAGVTWIELT